MTTNEHDATPSSNEDSHRSELNGDSAAARLAQMASRVPNRALPIRRMPFTDPLNHVSSWVASGALSWSQVPHRLAGPPDLRLGVRRDLQRPRHHFP